MSRYTIAQVTAALERAVAERGEDYVYRKRALPAGVAGGSGSVTSVCLYRAPATDVAGVITGDAGDPASDEADCGVGRVLQLLGDRAWDAVCDPRNTAGGLDVELQLNRVAITHSGWAAHTDLTRGQRGALGAFQDAQDAGLTWGNALADYRRHVAVRAWPAEAEAEEVTP